MLTQWRVLQLLVLLLLQAGIHCKQLPAEDSDHGLEKTADVKELDFTNHGQSGESSPSSGSDTDSDSPPQSPSSSSSEARNTETVGETAHPAGPPSTDISGSEDPSPRDTVEARIIDGIPAHPDRWPWSVALELGEMGFFCAGTLIDKQWVLAAAHCFRWNITHTSPLYAKIGAWNLSTSDQLDTVLVEEIILHPYFSRRDNPSPVDIAMLRLSRPANVSSSDVLALPDMMFNFFTLNPNCFIIGWGVHDVDTWKGSDVLRELRVRVIHHVECEKRWSRSIANPSVYVTNLCIHEGDYRNISACQGDSGSPLQCFDTTDMKWKMAGLSSWGSEACTVYPSVYIRVQSFLSWIYSVMSSDDRDHITAEFD